MADYNTFKTHKGRENKKTYNIESVMPIKKCKISSQRRTRAEVTQMSTEGFNLFLNHFSLFVGFRYKSQASVI